ncbi:MAG: HIT family protein [Acidovorax sp.]|jgi:diadenosine tetraphosphate (Ap4A) HIT family hydrolase|uniref:HIT family protein n=1 Tax=Acidovorax sp. TaxID=1872122 RepID=UPI0026016589|nr:HIT family protein [Acidovorax sp.]MDH4428502.1 HIT family protein [Acidovorax sp.]
MDHPTCPLCAEDGGSLIWRGAHLRVIRADEAGFPAFYRVIWNAHVAEFSGLSPADRAHCMEAVACVEEVLREHLAPTKINLAALGNMVPHLHWHVIARFAGDSHFPAPVWAAAQRERNAVQEAWQTARIPALEADLSQSLAQRFG